MNSGCTEFLASQLNMPSVYTQKSAFHIISSLKLHFKIKCQQVRNAEDSEVLMIAVGVKKMTGTAQARLHLNFTLRLAF